MSDDLIEFEERNWDTLFDKFIKIPQVFDLWSDFVYNEWEKQANYEPPED